jgi:serine/threonine protein kinase/Tfp pilus assembly protein PilF
VVGKFELLREIGRGGFGVVWEARDTELSRSVAFKAVRAGRAGPQEDRLLREAEAAARLTHPNIVTLFDLGRSEHGPYLVLELLRGKTLEERLAQGRLAMREAVRIACEVAKGVAHAHARGVVHRDLKPANVFLCDDGQVKVLDLGLARAFGQRRQDGGTPAYMAPEQWQGAPEDERTDVFALGVLLFRLLADAPPFPDDGGKAVQGPRRAPVLEVPELPALGQLVARMLEKSPVARPRDGAEVATALHGLQQELERSPVRGTTRVRTRPRAGLPGVLAEIRRNRGTALLVLGVVALAILALIKLRDGTPRQRPEASTPASDARPRTVAVLPLVNLSGDPKQEYFSDGMTEEITSKLSRLSGLAVTARTSAARYKGSPRSAREIGAELSAAFLVEGSVRRSGDRIRVTASLVRAPDAIQLWSEEFDARLDDIFAVQERIASRIVEALGVKLTPGEAQALGSWGTRNAAAYDEYLKGQATFSLGPSDREKVDQAAEHFGKALELDGAFAPALAGMAACEAYRYRDWGGDPARLDRAEMLAGRALALDPQLVPALKAAADVRGYRFDYLGAAQRYRRLLVLAPRDHIVWDQLCWALGYATPPLLGEAEDACRQAMELQPSYPNAHYHLLRVHVLAGRLDDAEADLAALDRLSAGSRFPVLPQAGRYWVAMARGRPAQGLAALRNTTNLADAWRAMALAQLGRKDEAFTALERALAGGYRDAGDLRSTRWYEPLRRDPRWAAALARHGLGP